MKTDNVAIIVIYAALCYGMYCLYRDYLEKQQAIVYVAGPVAADPEKGKDSE